ncbi:MAG: DNA polymerase III subunit alpha [Bacteroidales bacterium]|nr:DNA polymerase III subunit alpha [Bacteroidales bacterium]MBD5253625.1 DNA polymerase III subunit alpha [Barnesiella sp.]MBD5344330.1 DNA polymerase III subunit alpha [Bacteroides sp.]
MHPFVHLHVHSQYSLLDGQASIPSLVDKAIDDGQPGLALTDHGNMFGVKEYFNYFNKLSKKFKGKAAEAQEKLEAATDPAERAQLEAEVAKYKKKMAFKPIFGCEMYVAKGSNREQADRRDTGRHLIVLAKNLKGYKNLIKIVSDGFTDGFYSHPRTDHDSLAAHCEGLIVASACLGGEIPRHILNGDLEEAEKTMLWYKETFGDDYYVEIQRHRTDALNANTETYQTQQRVNPVLIDLARKHGIKIIATNDVHFTNEEDAEAHDRLICISTANLLNDPNRMHYTKQEWLKSTKEMNDIFTDIPEALDNTLEILDKVEVYSIDHAPIMPFFEIPAEFGTEEEYRSRLTEQDLFDEFTRDENGNVVLSPEEAEKKIKKLGGYDKLYRIKFEADYLSKLAYEGASRRYGDPLTPELKERINFELYIMKTMGFPGYFLIVQDFINVARHELGVSVGPGRGSAAGSVVAYCLGITQVDPIRYDLLFERFLNPDRISLPDIDVDFDDDGRADVLRYVTDKYGEDKVAHIITFGTMAAKSAIKDVARVENLPLPESDRLAKLVPKRMPDGPDGKTLKPTLSNCYKYVPEFAAELGSTNPLIVETLEYARRLEGNVRNTGVHACGVIICRDPITDWVPVSTAVDKSGDQKEKLIVTQYEGSIIEDTGLIKMDFLGLKTLSIIKEAVANIKMTTGKDIDIDTIDITDPATYKLYCEGRTTGTFQFESAGMQKYLRELQPSTFEDLIAMNALYRPGPMDYIPDFIARKHGIKPIEYDIPIMEKYLKDTYGVTVYQEQVMLLSRLLANFTRGQSDTLRKAMGKKLIDKMNELEALFIEGGKANGHDPKVLTKIWEDWKKFASYAFNKSHATCYSWVAFQTAWLKANYPAEYMAAVLSRNRNDITKLTGFMDECKRMRIAVKGPDVNESVTNFGVNSRGDIRFGLAAIKGVGENVVKAIIDERDANGPYENVYDFVERVPSGIINRRVFENLALAGAFDCFKDVKREDLLAENTRGETYSEILMRYGQAFQADKMKSAASLFGDDTSLTTAGRPEPAVAVEWTLTERLEKERELVGMYLSGNPLDPFYMELNFGVECSIKSFTEFEPVENVELTFGGLVVDFMSRPARNGGNFGIMKIEDYTGSTEFRLFGQQYIDFHKFGVKGTPVLVTGKYQRRYANSDLNFNITNIRLLEDVKGTLVHDITIDLPTDKLTRHLCDLLAGHLEPGRPGGELSFRMFDPKINRSFTMQAGVRIPITRSLVDTLMQEDIAFAINGRRARVLEEQ